MNTAGVIERVERVEAARARVRSGVLTAGEIEAGIGDIQAVRAHLDAVEAEMVGALKPAVSFPEATIADCTRGSIGSAAKTVERADTLADAPQLADALDAAAITAGHVDALTRATKGLDDRQRHELIERVDDLTDVATHATIDQFARRVRNERKRLLADEGVDRLEQQQRNTRLSTWVDDEGMWNVRGRFDPVTGVKLAAALDQAVERLFAESTPQFCPGEPVEKQAFLRAHAFARLVDGTAGTSRSGRPEFVVVIDADAKSREIDWGIPVEIPDRILERLIDDHDTAPVGVVVRNGIVLHAPGELYLGRSSRLANRAQRRALHALYRTCAIPGCSAHYSTTKLHHIRWWRHGGRTDLDNLLPVCAHHHGKIHHEGWIVELGPNRELTLTLPDGTRRSTGPPSRREAA